jgi:hypothetical protein
VVGLFCTFFVITVCVFFCVVVCVVVLFHFFSFFVLPIIYKLTYTVLLHLDYLYILGKITVTVIHSV